MEKKTLYIISGVLATVTIGYLGYATIQRKSVMAYLTKGYTDWSTTGAKFADLDKSVFAKNYAYNMTKNGATYIGWKAGDVDKYVLRFHDELRGNSITSILNPFVSLDTILALLKEVKTKVRLAQLAQAYESKYQHSLSIDLQNVGSSDKEAVFNAINALPTL